MAAKLETFGAPGVYDTPSYSQAIKVTGEFFGQRGPASTMVEVSSLSHPDYRIEIEAIAIL